MTDFTQLRAALTSDPSVLQKLAPHDFEELVAEILASQGYEVQITPATRDGGYDILAVRRDSLGLETTTVVECKRYAPNKKIGVTTVRSLYGVKTFLGVSNGAIITTSSFTNDAKRFAESKHDINLIDAPQLLQWIAGYVPPRLTLTHVEKQRFYSCFISHSSEDRAFVELLNTKLRTAGVRVWYAPDDLRPGKKLREQIKSAIRSFDKLLLILSHNSMTSEWVSTEIRDAKKLETQVGRRVLFPIAIIPMSEVRKWECFDSDTGKDLAVEVREYFIPDFSNWQNSESFDREIARLLGGLDSKYDR